jgi:hypothetical protein
MRRNIFIIVALLSCYSCHKMEPDTTRSFYMGVTPWPPDFNKKSVSLTYDFIDKHCDIVSQHFDEGIPWQEMLDNLPFPKKLQEDLNNRKAKSKNKKVFLSVAALQIDRLTRADYYNSTTLDKNIINSWASKKFDDSTVIIAYANYIERLMLFFNAEEINFAVECNHKDWNPEDLKKYQNFLAAVYKQLKTKYQLRQFMISYIVGPKSESNWLKHAKQLASVTDWMCISAYPYSYIGSPVYGSADPKLLPADLFDTYRLIDSSKPFAFGETGYIAENLNLVIVHKIADQQMQDDYLKFILDYCNMHHAKMLIWFCVYDYDAAVNTFSAIGYANELPKLWQNTGLYDEWLMPRLSAQRWIRWRTKIKN